MNKIAYIGFIVSIDGEDENYEDGDGDDREQNHQLFLHPLASVHSLHAANHNGQ